MNPHTIPTPPPPTPDWREAAACVDEDPDLFFPATSNGADGAWVIPRRICNGCPVQAACLDDVMADEGLYLSTAYRYGMRGGLTPADRRVLGQKLAADRKRGPKPIAHGTAAGHQAHLRRREP